LTTTATLTYCLGVFSCGYIAGVFECTNCSSRTVLRVWPFVCIVDAINRCDLSTFEYPGKEYYSKLDERVVQHSCWRRYQLVVPVSFLLQCLVFTTRAVLLVTTFNVLVIVAARTMANWTQSECWLTRSPGVPHLQYRHSNSNARHICARHYATTNVE
jgi:hypothetical protein